MSVESQIIALLRTLHYKVDFLHTQLVNIQMELKMAADKLSALEADVADTDTVVGSIETLVTNLVAELSAAQGSPDSDARIQAVIDKLDANKSRLAALVTANTPADPGTPVPPPVDTPAPVDTSASGSTP